MPWVTQRNGEVLWQEPTQIAGATPLPYVNPYLVPFQEKQLHQERINAILTNAEQAEANEVIQRLKNGLISAEEYDAMKKEITARYDEYPGNYSAEAQQKLRMEDLQYNYTAQAYAKKASWGPEQFEAAGFGNYAAQREAEQLAVGEQASQVQLGQEQQAHRQYQLNGGDLSFALWKQSGSPLTPPAPAPTAQEIYSKTMPKLGVPAAETYYRTQYPYLYQEFVGQSKPEEQTSQGWESFLKQYPWLKKYGEIPPAQRGTYPSTRRPVTRWLNY